MRFAFQLPNDDFEIILVISKLEYFVFAIYKYKTIH